MTKNEIPATTPWGEPQTVEVLAPGIVQFTTACHGGVWLSPERNARVPLKLKLETWNVQGLSGWYEEDCDAQIVFRFFNFGLASRDSTPDSYLTLADASARFNQWCGPLIAADLEKLLGTGSSFAVLRPLRRI